MYSASSDTNYHFLLLWEPCCIPYLICFGHSFDFYLHTNVVKVLFPTKCMNSLLRKQFDFQNANFMQATFCLLHIRMKSQNAELTKVLFIINKLYMDIWSSLKDILIVLSKIAHLMLVSHANYCTNSIQCVIAVKFHFSTGFVWNLWLTLFCTF